MWKDKEKVILLPIKIHLFNFTKYDIDLILSILNTKCHLWIHNIFKMFESNPPLSFILLILVDFVPKWSHNTWPFKFKPNYTHAILSPDHDDIPLYKMPQFAHINCRVNTSHPVSPPFIIKFIFNFSNHFIGLRLFAL